MTSGRRAHRCVALVVVLAVTACSGGDDDDDSASAPTTRRASTTSSSTATTTPPTTTTTAPAPPGPIAPDTPGDPRAAAAAITEAERTIHAPGTSADGLAAAARRQQATYRAIAARPEWDAELKRLVPAEFQAALDANVAAARDLRALTSPRTSLPAWRIVAPAPAEELLGHYREAERAFGVPWAYLAAIHLVETRMGRIRGASSAGARGPMQFMPATWEAYGEGDIESNRDAIHAAARYLKANGAPGDMANALWNYNHSDRYVRAVTRYAERMLADPAAYAAYWHWDVYYRLASGDVLLPIGWVGEGA